MAKVKYHFLKITFCYPGNKRTGAFRQIFVIV